MMLRSRHRRNLPHDLERAPVRRVRGTLFEAHDVGVVNEVEARELARRELTSEDLVITSSERISRTWVVSFNNRK